MLIVLSGEAGAGKDSVARVLVESHGWVLHSLAGPLKRFAKDIFGFSDEQLYGPSSARNEPDPRWIRPCSACGGTGLVEFNRVLNVNERCRPCDGTGKLNDNSPRRVLQLLGEEYLRQMIHPDALTMRARPDIEQLLHGGKHVVVNDARNPNDRDNLRAWLGAHRVDVRAPATHVPGATWRMHVSEQRQPGDKELEYVLVNEDRYPFPHMAYQVKKMLWILGCDAPAS